MALEVERGHLRHGGVASLAVINDQLATGIAAGQHHALRLGAHRANDHFQLMHGVIVQTAGAGDGEILNAFVTAHIVQTAAAAQRAGGAQAGAVGFGQLKHAHGRCEVGGEGLVHIDGLAAHQRFAAQTLVLLGVVRRQHDDHVGLLAHCFAGFEQLNAKLGAPLLAAQATLARVVFPCVGHLEGNAEKLGLLLNPLGVVVGVPLVQIEIDETDLDHAFFLPFFAKPAQLRVVKPVKSEISQHLRSTLEGRAQGFIPAPAVDMRLIAVQKNRRNRQPAVFARARILGVFEQTAGKALVYAGILAAEHARHQPGYRVHQNQRAELAAGKHIVAHGNFLVDHQIDCALVDALVVPAQENQLFFLREPLHGRLGQGLSAGGEIDAPAVEVVAHGGFHGVHNRLGEHHHARAAAVGRVVGVFVLVLRVGANVDDLGFNRAGGDGAPQNALAEHRADHVRKDGQYLKFHRLPPLRAAVSRSSASARSPDQPSGWPFSAREPASRAASRRERRTRRFRRAA